jgi:hypothetical protein
LPFPSRLFGSLIWIVRRCDVALQHFLTHMLSLKRSLWGAGRFRKL